MKRLILVAVAAMVLSFGAGSVAANSSHGQAAGFADLGSSSSLVITFTEGWFEREVTQLGPRKCFKRCKENCKWDYKRCKRKYGKNYCKNKKHKCKRRCRRRCQY